MIAHPSGSPTIFAPISPQLDSRRNVFALADEARALLMLDRQPCDFNLGVNVGRAAGPTVFHVHLHLITRYDADVANPRGGARGVIPAR